MNSNWVCCNFFSPIAFDRLLLPLCLPRHRVRRFKKGEVKKIIRRDRVRKIIVISLKKIYWLIFLLGLQSEEAKRLLSDESSYLRFHWSHVKPSACDVCKSCIINKATNRSDSRDSGVGMILIITLSSQLQLTSIAISIFSATNMERSAFDSRFVKKQNYVAAFFSI